MEPPENTRSKSRRQSRIPGVIYIICLLIFVVGGAISIPFVYESQTLWYKIGMDKTLLRTGQIAGLLAAILLLVQILLAVRGKTLEELFGAAALMRWHRVNGVLVLFLALCHVILILVPEGIANLPIGLKFWPEMVGGALLLILFSMVLSSQFRQQLGFTYAGWRIMHKSFGYLALVLVGVHILFVSESFEHAVPKAALITSLAAVVITLVRVKCAACIKKRK